MTYLSSTLPSVFLEYLAFPLPFGRMNDLLLQIGVSHGLYALNWRLKIQKQL